MSIKEVEDILAGFDLVLIAEDERSLEIARMIADSGMLDSTQKNLAFLTIMPFDVPVGRHMVRHVSEYEMKTIMDIFRTYEASDKFVLLSESNTYGGLWNYVKSGVLSREEALRALLM